MAVDADDIIFNGFIMERLFSSAEMPKREARCRRYERTLQLATIAAFQDVLGYPWNGQDNEVTCNSSLSVDVAELLSSRKTLGLGGAFSHVARVLRDEGAVLDLLPDGNILFGLNGKLRLADPVTGVYPLGQSFGGAHNDSAGGLILRPGFFGHP